MLQLPDDLTEESFLAHHWQKVPLFMPRALPRLRPSITRNELAWLATLDDVESRIVFADRGDHGLRYRVANGPFDTEYLAALPGRDWTLLVHDVEKHLPAMRALFSHLPFIPDWRIDDLMVSFAAPGGGVGPHRDNYDVFLCQGIGIREWRTTLDDPGPDPAASNDLALLHEFEGSRFEAREGDVLYLPPGVPHWGTAQRACMTYSIGMRAPQLAELADSLPDCDEGNAFYGDADLSLDEVAAGRISRRAVARALHLLGESEDAFDRVATALGRCVTTTKEWLTPAMLDDEETDSALRHFADGRRLEVHGMARIAWDANRVYVNGRSHDYPPAMRPLVERICQERHLVGQLDAPKTALGLVRWMLRAGAFEIPGNS
jgi:50S ribosomal protein L16 3-hydroxylase